MSVLLPDDARAIIRGGEESVGVLVPVERAHIGVVLYRKRYDCVFVGTYLGEDFKEGPLVAVKIIIGSKD